MIASKTIGAAFIALSAALTRVSTRAEEDPFEAKMRLRVLEGILMRALDTVRTMDARLSEDVADALKEGLVDAFTEQLDSLPTAQEPGDAA